MNKYHAKVEACRRLISELRWNERNAEQSARIAVSKAFWLGLEKQQIYHLISSTPSASHLRQCPNIFLETWTAITKAAEPGQNLTEFERLLNEMN